MTTFRTRIEKYKRAYLRRTFALLIGFVFWIYAKDISSLTDLFIGAIIIVVLEYLFVNMATDRDFYPASALTHYLEPERERTLNFFIFLSFYVGYTVVGLVALIFWV